MPKASKSNVAITFEGLQTIFVGPEDEQCTVGVVRDVPQGHDFEIRILKEDASGTFQPFAQISQPEIKKTLSLKVTNATQNKISRRKMEGTFDRTSGPTPDNVDSFRWVLDLENEIYSKPIGVKPKGFASLLKVNAGELVTRTISTNKLIKLPPNGAQEIVGRVATRSGIDIVLDKPQSKAVFKNGNKIIFSADSQSRFHITFRRICEANQGGSDAEAYYTAVGHLIPDPEKIRFSATLEDPSLPNDSDARCMGCSMSRSKPAGS